MTTNLTDARALLERTPATLRALLGGLPATWTDATEGPGTWSPHVIVAHLVHAERANWIPRARTIVEHGRTRPIAAFDQEGQRDIVHLPLDALLDDFAHARAASLATLASWALDDDGLAREGEHPVLGTVVLRQLLSAWVAHDLSHLAQVARVMAKQYRDAVGPWRRYLPIMER